MENLDIIERAVRASILMIEETAEILTRISEDPKLSLRFFLAKRELAEHNPFTADEHISVILDEVLA